MCSIFCVVIHVRVYYLGVQRCDQHSTGAAQRQRPHLAHLPRIRIELAIAKDLRLAKTGPEIGAIIGRAIGI